MIYGCSVVQSTGTAQVTFKPRQGEFWGRYRWDTGGTQVISSSTPRLNCHLTNDKSSLLPSRDPVTMATARPASAWADLSVNVASGRWFGVQVVCCLFTAAPCGGVRNHPSHLRGGARRWAESGAPMSFCPALHPESHTGVSCSTVVQVMHSTLSLTSFLSVACVRAQTNESSQVTSHRVSRLLPLSVVAGQVRQSALQCLLLVVGVVVRLI